MCSSQARRVVELPPRRRAAYVATSSLNASAILTAPETIESFGRLSLAPRAEAVRGRRRAGLAGDASAEVLDDVGQFRLCFGEQSLRAARVLIHEEAEEKRRQSSTREFLGESERASGIDLEEGASDAVSGIGVVPGVRVWRVRVIGKVISP